MEENIRVLVRVKPQASSVASCCLVDGNSIVVSRPEVGGSASASTPSRRPSTIGGGASTSKKKKRPPRVSFGGTDSPKAEVVATPSKASRRLSLKPSVSAKANTFATPRRTPSRPSTASTPYSTNRQTDRTFCFDRVFPASATQGDIYSEVAPYVDGIIDGYNATVFAYGQTGSGKTYTMTGEELNAGIIPRAVERLFDLMSSRPDTQYSVDCTYVELYNDTFRDLLDADNSPEAIKKRLVGHKESKIVLREDRAQGCVFLTGSPGINTPVTCESDVMALIAQGCRARTVGETNSNAHSSRSHAIFTISVESVCGPRVTRAKLHLVDLAGSERAKKSGAQGMQLTEASAINSSLTALGDVLSALSSGSNDRVPYRNSKLTMLLKDSLGGSARTIMIATVQTPETEFHETTMSLKWAARAKKVRNTTVANVDKIVEAELEEAHREISTLKGKLDKRVADVSRLTDTVDELECANEDLRTTLAAVRAESDATNRALQTQLDELIKKHATEVAELEYSLASVQAQYDEANLVLNNRSASNGHQSDKAEELAAEVEHLTDYIIGLEAERDESMQRAVAISERVKNLAETWESEKEDYIKQIGILENKLEEAQEMVNSRESKASKKESVWKNELRQAKLLGSRAVKEAAAVIEISTREREEHAAVVAELQETIAELQEFIEENASAESRQELVRASARKKRKTNRKRARSVSASSTAAASSAGGRKGSMKAAVNGGGDSDEVSETPEPKAKRQRRARSKSSAAAAKKRLSLSSISTSSELSGNDSVDSADDAAMSDVSASTEATTARSTSDKNSKKKAGKKGSVAAGPVADSGAVARTRLSRHTPRRSSAVNEQSDNGVGSGSGFDGEFTLESTLLKTKGGSRRRSSRRSASRTATAGSEPSTKRSGRGSVRSTTASRKTRAETLVAAANTALNESGSSEAFDSPSVAEYVRGKTPRARRKTNVFLDLADADSVNNASTLSDSTPSALVASPLGPAGSRNNTANNANIATTTTNSPAAVKAPVESDTEEPSSTTTATTTTSSTTTAAKGGRKSRKRKLYSAQAVFTGTPGKTKSDFLGQFAAGALAIPKLKPASNNTNESKENDSPQSKLAQRRPGAPTTNPLSPLTT